MYITFCAFSAAIPFNYICVRRIFCAIPEISFLVVCSLGGYLSSAYAIAYPSRVAGLIRLSPAGIPSTPGVRDGVKDVACSSAPSPSLLEYVWRLMDFGWNLGITLGMICRRMGPLGMYIGRHIVVCHLTSMSLEYPFSAIQLSRFGEYFYHTNAIDGSGEFALRHLLVSGSYAARIPIGDRLISAAQRRPGDLLRLPDTCRVTFIYGSTHDWMDASAGDAVASALNKCGVSSQVHRVGPAGPHLSLEAPSRVNDVMCSEIRTCIQSAIASGQ